LIVKYWLIRFSLTEVGEQCDQAKTIACFSYCNKLSFTFSNWKYFFAPQIVPGHCDKAPVLPGAL
jgi:hypothetical protein